MRKPILEIGGPCSPFPKCTRRHRCPLHTRGADGLPPRVDAHVEAATQKWWIVCRSYEPECDEPPASAGRARSADAPGGES